MNHACIALLFVAAASAQLLLTSFSVRQVSTPAGAVTTPVEIRLAPYAGLLRTVDVKLGDFETPFLFDTGGGSTILSIDAAKRAGCTIFGRGTGFRHDGQRVDGQRGTSIELSFGGVARRGEVGVMDLGPLLGGLPPVGGIASLETFAGRAISIDLAHNRVIVESEKSLLERTQGARELKARVAHQAGGASYDLFVAIEGRHGPLWFELDSGNLQPVLIAPYAFAELGLEPPLSDKSLKVDLRLVGFGPVQCDAVAKEMICDGLLNAEFFLRHVVTFDLEKNRVWLRANP